MLASFAAHSSNHPRRLWLTLAALVVGGFYLILPLFWGLLLGIGLILTALLERSPRRFTRIMLALALLAILAIPWTCRYWPAVVAAPGYEMRWPTQPDDLLGNVGKRSQAFWETRTCDYSVLGWDVEGVLYYEEACEGRAPQVWAYNPDQDSYPHQVDPAPVDLFQEAISRSSILERVCWSADVCPSDDEPMVRRVAVRVDGMASPDGRWVAVVVRHIYGPEDVIVLSSLPLS